MAKIRGSKEGVVHDPSLTMSTEPKTSESIKQKIAKIQDMFPDATKDQIAKILQFYDNDESKAIDAITRDGGSEALTNMADAGSLKSKNTKNKKKKKKAKKDSGIGLTTTASFDADDSSSLHSGGNVEADVEKDCQRADNGALTNIVDETENLDNVLSNHERLSREDVGPITPGVEHKTELKFPQETVAPFPAEDSFLSAPMSAGCDKSNAESTPCISPSLGSSEKQEQVLRREKYRPITESYSRQQAPRQRTSSFRRNKSSSVSEDSSSQYNPQATAAPTKRGYDKCKKDLNRQTISLTRIQAQLEKGFEDSEKRMKSIMAELIGKMENRQKELEAELEKKKIEAFDLLKSRQDLAVELKRRVERTPSITEAEWAELRSDIKQFVTERKYDDDLGKTIWFQWSDPSDVINSFGEVQPVKNVYSQRSHTALSGNSGVSNINPDPSPSSSLANDEIESSADKNDVGNISDAVEEETPVMGKEEIPTYNKSQPNENRTSRTIYPSTRYDPNRFNQGRFSNHRGYRGNRGGGGGFQRPNFRRNFHYNNNRYSNYNNNNEDFKTHPDREGRMNEGPVYTGGRNANNPRDNKIHRNHGREHMNYGYNARYNRENARGGHRHNPENTETEPSVGAANVNVEKAIVNGFTNN